jgi:NAD(P)-dependent dehydrogenase (short-subunit alcohol dehydrogenase family)
MELEGRRVVVTGGASGIGEALARAFAAAGAASVVVADVDAEGAERVAADVGGLAVPTDVTSAEEIDRLVHHARTLGPIDLFCSNAGVFGGMAGIEATPETWDLVWQVNVMAHVKAAQAVLPEMLARGEGYLLNTASAAGLLMNLGALPYSVTKHAAVAMAEWLSVKYGKQGIRVSCLCPQGVKTPMLTTGGAGGPGSATMAAGDLLEPEEVAQSALAGIRTEEFLILPHERVARYAATRVTDKERWLSHLRDLQETLDAEREAAARGELS